MASLPAFGPGQRFGTRQAAPDWQQLNQLICERVPLEDYLAGYLQLEVIFYSTDRQLARCPFHDEQTPSLVISRRRSEQWKSWYCYGCQEGGTIIDAIVRAERLTNTEAVRVLNLRYQLQLFAAPVAS